MNRLAICLLLAFLLKSSPLLADSDGYFCAGTGYLAYEFSFSKEMPHTLFVIHFDSSIGILNPKTVRVDDFQVHGMKCGRGILELQAFDKSYFFDVSDRTKQPIALQKPQSPLDTTDSVSGNLGHSGKAAVLDLRARGSEKSFQLVIAKAERRISGGIEHFTSSTLIQRTESRKIVHSLALFEGIFLETIDSHSEDQILTGTCPVSPQYGQVPGTARVPRAKIGAKPRHR